MARKHEPGDVVLGRYRLRARVGRGGFGVVWAADASDGSRVAVKMLLRADQDGLKRFGREARALRRLRHGNCTGFVEFATDADGTPILVSEFAEGIDLHAWSRSGRDVEEVVDVAVQIANGLQAAHDVGVTHRDLKPPNILIDERDGTVKVLDFGLAKLHDEQGDVTKTGEVFGTPGFMSPEQLRGQKDIGPSTDWYCLGVILFELLEGRPPFVGDSPIVIAMKHLQEPVPQMTSAPRELAELVHRLMHKDPAERPRSAREVIAMLRFDDTRERRRPSRPRPHTPVQRRGRVVFLVALVLLAAGALWVVASTKSEPAVSARHVRRAAPLLHPQPAVPSVMDAGVDAAASVTCGSPLIHGRQELKWERGMDSVFMDGFIPRTFAPGKRMPAMVLFHDRKQGPSGVLEELNLDAHAHRHGFAMLAPQNTNPITNRGWDDQRMLASVWEDVLAAQNALCLDTDGFVLIGHGRGGHAADYLSRTTEGVRAVVVDAYRWRPDEAMEVRKRMGEPVAYLLLASMHDVPREGRTDTELRLWYESRSRISLDEHVDILRARNKCTGTKRVVHQSTGGTCHEFLQCAARLVVCELDATDHWPGHVQRYDDKPSYTVPASEFPYREFVMNFVTLND